AILLPITATCAPRLISTMEKFLPWSNSRALIAIYSSLTPPIPTLGFVFLESRLTSAFQLTCAKMQTLDGTVYSFMKRLASLYRIRGYVFSTTPSRFERRYVRE